MASPVHDISVKGMRKTHFEQLAVYADSYKEAGWHYGNKAQFKKRHEELVEWIDDIILLFEHSL